MPIETYIKNIRCNLKGYSYKGFAYWRTRHVSAETLIKRLLIKHPYEFYISTVPIRPYHGIKNSLMYQAFMNDPEYRKALLNPPTTEWELYPKGLERPDLRE